MHARYSRGVLELAFKTIDHAETMRLRMDYDRRDRFNAQVLKSHLPTMIIIGITFLKGYALGFVDDDTRRVMTLDHL